MSDWSSLGRGPLYDPKIGMNKVPKYIRNKIKHSIINEDDFFYGGVLNLLNFFKNEELDILMIDEHGKPRLVARDRFVKNDREKAKILFQTLDFVPLTLQTPNQKFKIIEKKSNSKWILQMHDDVITEEIDFDYEMTSDNSAIIDYLVSSFPSISLSMSIDEPVYFAVERIDDYIQLVGVFGVQGTEEKFGLVGDERLAVYSDRYSVPPEVIRLCIQRSSEALISSSMFLAQVIHDVAKENARISVTVGASVVDRLSTYFPSIPISLLSKELALNTPICFRFTKLSIEEIFPSLESEIEFTIFRDDIAIYITHKKDSQNHWSHITRLLIDDITDDKGNITPKRIESSLRKSLSLHRGQFSEKKALSDDISFSFPTQCGKLLWFWMKNMSIVGQSDKRDRSRNSGGDFLTQYYVDTGSIELLVNFIPMVINLTLGLFDPLIAKAEKISVYNEKMEKKRGQRKNSPGKRSRKFMWGNNKVRYVTPGKSDSSVNRQWVRPHSHSYHVSNQATIDRYRQNELKGLPGYKLIQQGEKYLGIKTVGNYYRGKKDSVSNWDGTYNFGKTTKRGNYSQAAIRWLRFIENREQIEIRHAERGGEQKIPLGINPNTGKEKYIWVDGYHVDTATVYEFHGDVWHGNPKLFERECVCHPHLEGEKGTAGYLYDKTIERENEIRNLGFNLVTIWESEWNEIQN